MTLIKCLVIFGACVFEYPIHEYAVRSDCIAEKSELIWAEIYAGNEIPVLRCE